MTIQGPGEPQDPVPGPARASSVFGEADDAEEEVENLDKFLANHTSEDNENFEELQEQAYTKHRLKNGWMYKVGAKAMACLSVSSSFCPSVLFLLAFISFVFICLDQNILTRPPRNPVRSIASLFFVI